MNIFNPIVIGELFRASPLLMMLGVFAGAFLLTFILIPKILWVIKEKKLLKPVIARSVHTMETPSFGGVAFFMTLVLLVSMLQSFQIMPTGNHFIAGLTILFMVGLKDDLVVSSPRAKLLGQLIAVAFIVFSPELAITSLHGFLGIQEIPLFVGYLITTAFMLLIINGFNLIDGINGLAGIIGIIICSCYGLVFYFTGNDFFMLLSLTVIGMLLAFLRFNLSRKENKIFMGDSGSLVIGFIIGFLTIRILAMPVQSILLENGFSPMNRVPFVISVLFIPLFDTFRVILLRLYNGRSPFKAGQDHVHHLLLNCSLNHPKASVVLGLLNLLVIAIFLLLFNNLSVPYMLGAIIGLFILFFLGFQLIANRFSERPSEPKEERRLFKKINGRANNYQENGKIREEIMENSR